MPNTDQGAPRRFEKWLESTLRDQIRVDLLRVLGERPASIKELAERFDEDLSQIAARVLDLWRDGTIELNDAEDAEVALADRRFRLTARLIDEDEWTELSPDEQYEETVRIVQSLLGELMAALRTGHLTSRPDTHLTWMPMKLDEEGWRETFALLERAFREANSIKVRSAQRLRETGDEGNQMVVSLLGFERSR